MTLTERIDYCKRMIKQQQAELSGLQSAWFNFTDASHCYTNEDERRGYQRGREEGLDILHKGEGR